MKLTLTILLMSMLARLCCAQERVLYINFCEDFVDEANYDIKRVIRNHPERKFQYLISDYYKNGQLFTSGLAKASNGKTRDGEYAFHYPNGKKMAYGYLEKGVRKGVWNYWDSTGVAISKDNLAGQRPVTVFKNDSILMQGKCLCYFKELDWTKVNNLTHRATAYVFSDGGQLAEDGVYTVTDSVAKYKTGIDEFMKYLANELTYPFLTRLKGKQGKVFVKFTIDPKGNLMNPIFLTILDKPTERKIKNVLMASSGNWKSAIYKGKAVSSTLILPVTFELK